MLTDGRQELQAAQGKEGKGMTSTQRFISVIAALICMTILLVSLVISGHAEMAEHIIEGTGIALVFLAFTVLPFWWLFRGLR